MKARALAKCQVDEAAKGNCRWHDDPELMTFLRSL